MGETKQTREETLRNDFAKKSAEGILSNEQLEKMRNETEKRWTKHYDGLQEVKPCDLAFVPAFTNSNDWGRARGIIGNLVSGERYDSENSCIYHSRLDSCGPCGSKFVALEDQVKLVIAVTSTGDYQQLARNVMAVTRDLFVKIDYRRLTSDEEAMKRIEEAVNLTKKREIELREKPRIQTDRVTLPLKQFEKNDKLTVLIRELSERGFEVEYASFQDIARRVDQMQKPQSWIPNGSNLFVKAVSDEPVKIRVLPYVNFETGKILEVDSYTLARESGSNIAKYLVGELAIGNNDLVYRIMKSLKEEDCSTFVQDETITAAKYLKLWREVASSKEDEPYIVTLSKRKLEKNLVKDWGLYKAGDIEVAGRGPEMDCLNACNQLNVAFLNIINGQMNEARNLLTMTVNAGLYRDGEFVDRDCTLGGYSPKIRPETNALGVIVLEKLLNS
ncbi:hypothetical protein HY450_00700 [Candidatus Pacearchaeota archaeon]|nr:hypothetical protein [Candidatus Pacearchaeota archaeon]